MPDVSIVIPMYNGADFVQERLSTLDRALRTQDLNYELIVSDDGSEDGSPDIVEAMALAHTQVLRSPRNEGKFGALIRGVGRSRGRCVLFTDADIPLRRRGHSLHGLRRR